MKNVLIALDCDPISQKIAETGYRLAKAMNARMILLHVISDPVYYSSLNYTPITGFDGVDSIDTIQQETTDLVKKRLKRFLNSQKIFSVIKVLKQL